MSGSGMIAARPEGLAVDVEAEPLGCVSGCDGPVVDFDDPFGTAERFTEGDLRFALVMRARWNALGIIMLAAAKCTDVQGLADCGRIDRDGADLFIRRYSESICDIASALAPEAMRDTMTRKGN
jgi:hypothetical protein